MESCYHKWIKIGLSRHPNFEVCGKCRTTRDVGTMEAKPGDAGLGHKGVRYWTFNRHFTSYFCEPFTNAPMTFHNNEEPDGTKTDFHRKPGDGAIELIPSEVAAIRAGWGVEDKPNPSTESKGSTDHVADPSKMVPDRAELFALWIAFISDGGHFETSYDDAVKALETFNRLYGEKK